MRRESGDPITSVAAYLDRLDLAARPVPFARHGHRLPAYQNNLRRLGFTDDDLVPGGSDRLIDAVVARGLSRFEEFLLDAYNVHVLGGTKISDQVRYASFVVPVGPRRMIEAAVTA